MFRENPVKSLMRFGLDLNQFMFGRKIACQADADKATEDVKAEIKKRFYRLALEKHPDKGGNAEEFKVLSAAYANINNELKIYHKPPQPQIPIFEFTQQSPMFVFTFGCDMGFSGGGTTSNTTW